MRTSSKPHRYLRLRHRRKWDMMKCNSHCTNTDYSNMRHRNNRWNHKSSKGLGMRCTCFGMGSRDQNRRRNIQRSPSCRNRRNRSRLCTKWASLCRKRTVVGKVCNAPDSCSRRWGWLDTMCSNSS